MIKTNKAITASSIVFASFILLNLLCPSVASAQSSSAGSGISAAQAGTLTIRNGQASVILDTKVTDKLNTTGSEYYVVFTPIGGFMPISISDKNNTRCTVAVGRADAGSIYEGAKLEFVVFVTEAASQAGNTSSGKALDTAGAGSNSAKAQLLPNLIPIKEE